MYKDCVNYEDYGSYENVMGELHITCDGNHHKEEKWLMRRMNKYDK